MPSCMHFCAVAICSPRSHHSPCGRQWLLITAVAHPDLVEDEFVHQGREGFPRNIHHQQLLDRHSAAGVSPQCIRHRIDANRIAFAGFSPFSTCTSVGRGSSTSYPGNPCTVSPAVCDINRRSVTLSVFVKSFSGTFQVFSFTFTSSSSDSLPCSTRHNAPVAATGLLIDPAWYNVCVVTGVFDPIPITP